MAKDREQIIQRIKKLKAHAESAEKIGSLEEAKVFMTKVQELMIEHNLSMFEVDTAKEDEEVLKGFSYAEKISYKDGTYYKYRFNLIKILCRHNFCKVVYNTNSKYFTVYGNGVNVDNVVWQYWYLAIRLKNLALEVYRNFRHLNRFQFISDFLLCAVVGIDEVLTKQASEHNEVRAIALFNGKMVQKYMEQLGVTGLRTIKSKNRSEFGIGGALGYQAGKNLQTEGKKLG
jgi:hypothetical protein